MGMAVDIVRDIAGIFKRDWKLFLASNIFLFGLFVLGILVGQLFPDIHEMSVDFIEQAASTGPISTVSDTLESGDVLLGTWQIFSHNYFVTVVFAAIPSLLFPPWILVVFGAQFFLFGIIFSVPALLTQPVALFPLLGTLLLEGEAYVVAIFASMRLVEALVWPKRFGEQSALKAYARAIVDNGKLLVVAGVILAAAALFEAASLVMVGGA
ncbi:MAG: hypothetical protein A4E28_01412 [Methanocella sp. PtaU1.Bin125]|nr:MAG: hypothetical protein A4E28_01412 [Methanocella sp. PtaU1.Bin125]